MTSLITTWIRSKLEYVCAVSSGIITGTATILSEPSEPDAKTYLIKAIMVVVFGFLGALGAGLYLFDLGLYSVGLERFQETIRDAQGTFTGETSVSTNWGDKDIILDDDQQKFLAFMTMVGIFSSFGLMDAGLYRTLDKIKTEQLKGGGSGGGSTQPRPRPRPRLAPRPRPARNLN